MGVDEGNLLFILIVMGVERYILTIQVPGSSYDVLEAEIKIEL